MEKTKTKNNYENMKQINEDNILAKAAGVSYGKFKANMNDTYAPSSYEVNTRSYLMPHRKDENKKSVAMIRFA